MDTYDDWNGGSYSSHIIVQLHYLLDTGLSYGDKKWSIKHSKKEP